VPIVPRLDFLPLIAFAITASAVWWLVHGGARQIVLDQPNKRSLHQQPVPRTGGLGLHVGILAVGPFAAPGMPLVVWMVFLGLLILSFMDDLRGLPAIFRFAAHLAGSIAIAATMVFPTHGLMAAGAVALVLTWLINLYNFMDGADGLAGGMALFGFSFYGIAAWLVGQSELAAVSYTIAAAAAAFLLFNFHPARIFLGDAGSVPLGFLAGTLGVIGWLQQVWTWWFPVLVFSPFIVDSSVTLARRIFARACIWEAHRDHYYQRLVRMGWGHRRTALAEYALMAVCGAVALAGLHLPLSAQTALLVTVTVVYIFIVAMVHAAWRKFLSVPGNEA
jgi:UDP-N-acetylmuramyl pentapeptide phosphotransferase/UDP-N-acetylglucosamine-1-phosphate transferase